ncbi:MAG: DUF2207 domain-containing protein [Anaerolineaceae bacterium]
MIKKLALICLVLGMLAIPMSAFAGKDYIAEQFDVDIDLKTDGSMQATETIAFRFMGGPFTYVYRDLEKTRTDGISFVCAGQDGIPLPVNGETALDWVEVEDGDPLSVTWHFQPTTDQTRIYSLTYQVSGVVRKNGTDTIVWMAIPQDHDYRVQGSRITVNYPSGAKLSDLPLLSGSLDYRVESVGNPVILTTGPVEVDTPLVLTLNFGGGTLTENAPVWQINEQRRQERSAKTMPITIAGFLSVFFVLMIVLVVIARKPRTTDEITLPPSTNRPVSPPTDYKPAVAAVLAARLNPMMMHSLATLIDLAQRGIVTIEQLPGKWLNSNRFELVRLPYSGSLSPHEQVLMEALFTKRGQPIERIDLSEYAQLLSKRWSDFSKAIKLEISALGLINPERKQQQIRMFIVSVCMLLAGFFLAIGMAIFIMARPSPLSLDMDQLASGFLGGFIALFGSGVIYIIFAALYTPLSAEGRWISSQWNGFAKYLKDIIALREQTVRPDTFSHFLPFAAGFGLGSQWAKSFHKRGSAEVPTWFHALNAQDADGSYGAFTAFMANSSSSASSSSSGGAGGASGGGGSGAG